jgi:hypothetical protein
MPRRTWSVEAKRGGFTLWEDVEALTADEARGIYMRKHRDADVVAVSLGASKVSWFKEDASLDEMLNHIAGNKRT